MEKFDLILHLVTYLHVFAPFLTHGEKAVASNHEPNFKKEGTSSRVEILKLKRRETDYCERVIKYYGVKKPAVCSNLGDLNLACERAQCIIKPGPPSKLEYTLQPNKTSKKVDLHISWKEPKAGLKRLCGFQIQVSSLTNFIREYCIQLNSKNLFSYTFPGLNFNTQYNITILSLPPFKDAEKSSKSILAESPDECKVFKHWNESPPWFCNITNNFSVACINGSLNFTFEKLHKLHVDRYYSLLMRRGSRGPPIDRGLHTKDDPFIGYSNLTLNAEYILLITVGKGLDYYTLKSKPFTCKELSATTKPYNSEKKGIGLLWKILIPLICVALLVLLVSCIKFKWISKLKQRFRPNYSKTPLSNPEDINLAEKEQVDL